MVLRAIFSPCQEVHRGQEESKQGISGCCMSVSDPSRTLTALAHPHGVSVRWEQRVIPILQPRCQEPRRLCSLRLLLQETRRKSETCPPILDARHGKTEGELLRGPGAMLRGRRRDAGRPGGAALRGVLPLRRLRGAGPPPAAAGVPAGPAASRWQRPATRPPARSIARGEILNCASPGPGRGKASVLCRAQPSSSQGAALRAAALLSPQHKAAGWSAFLGKKKTTEQPAPKTNKLFKRTNRILGARPVL